MALAATVIAGAPFGAARAGNGDNTAVAINTRDGSTVFSVAFRIMMMRGDVIDPTNAAAAVASCELCQTVAIAAEAVFIIGDASVVSPTNLAIAYNIDCVTCTTLASAYQFVITTSGPIHLTPEGQIEVESIRAQLERLRTADLSIYEIQAELDTMMQDLARVLLTEVVVAGKPSTATDTATPTGTTTTTTKSPPSPTSSSTTSSSTSSSSTSSTTSTTSSSSSSSSTSSSSTTTTTAP